MHQIVTTRLDNTLYHSLLRLNSNTWKICRYMYDSWLVQFLVYEQVSMGTDLKLLHNGQHGGSCFTQKDDTGAGEPLNCSLSCPACSCLATRRAEWEPFWLPCLVKVSSSRGLPCSCSYTLINFCYNDLPFPHPLSFLPLEDGIDVKTDLWNRLYW